MDCRQPTLGHETGSDALQLLGVFASQAGHATISAQDFRSVVSETTAPRAASPAPATMPTA